MYVYMYCHMSDFGRCFERCGFLFFMTFLFDNLFAVMLLFVVR
jgi:hypothetical protein